MIGTLRAAPAERVPNLLRAAAAWLVVAIFSASWIVTANRATRGAEHWGRALWLNLGSYAIWALLALPLVRLSRRTPWDPERKWRFVASKLTLAVTFAVLHAAVFVLLLSVGRSAASLVDSYWLAFSHTLRFNFHFDFLTALLVLFADESLGWYRRYRRQEVRTARLVEQLAKFRLEAAQLQLHPHFVFNALSSVAEMLYVDSDQAERLVLRLSSLLRTMLESSRDQLTPLREEIDFVRRYLEIEKTRFDERLQWHLDASGEALDVQVPSMLLQPLIDNAIVHGIARLDRPGELTLLAEVVAERLHLVLVNDTSERIGEHSVEPSSHGLTSTRARLDHFFGAGRAQMHHELSPSRDRFRVSLSIPLHPLAVPVVDGDSNAPSEVVWTRS